MPTVQGKFDLKVIEHIEQQIDDSSKSYFETTLNFIKWNTAISIGAVLWLGNYVITTKTSFDLLSKILVFFSLFFFLASLLISVGIFYEVSKFFNKCWILNSRWRKSYLASTSSCPIEAEQTEVNEVISDLSEHQKNLPEKAEFFDFWITAQLFLQFLGLFCFFAFIIYIFII